MYSLPNLLTIGRILVIFPIVACFFLEDFMGEAVARWTAWTFFAMAAVTDFFDGWLARRSNQISRFGQFLDPIADKLLVAAVIVMLASFQRYSPWVSVPATIIMCREILVSGLREFLAGTKVSMPVSTLAKWKTTIQLLALGFLIVGDKAGEKTLMVLFNMDTLLPVQFIGEVLLTLAAAITLITGYDYLRAGLAHIAADEGR